MCVCSGRTAPCRRLTVAGLLRKKNVASIRSSVVRPPLTSLLAPAALGRASRTGKRHQGPPPPLGTAPGTAPGTQRVPATPRKPNAVAPSEKPVGRAGLYLSSSHPSSPQPPYVLAKYCSLTSRLYLPSSRGVLPNPAPSPRAFGGILLYPLHFKQAPSFTTKEGRTKLDLNKTAPSNGGTDSAAL